LRGRIAFDRLEHVPGLVGCDAHVQNDCARWGGRQAELPVFGFSHQRHLHFDPALMQVIAQPPAASGAMGQHQNDLVRGRGEVLLLRPRGWLHARQGEGEGRARALLAG